MADKAGHTQIALQYSDTPPASPSTNVPPIIIPNRRIHIDDNGVHDFDFKKRPEGTHPPPNKLQKFSRHSGNYSHNRTPSSMSAGGMHDRRSSADSDTSSIRKRFSAILTGKPALQKTNSNRSNKSQPSPTTELPEDALPDTKQALEVRLNYHLSELDQLKKTISSANGVISQHEQRYEILLTRQNTIGGEAGGIPAPRAMQVQEDLIAQARRNRNAWWEFVSFHRQQLERIKLKRIEIETEAGLEPTLPQVFRSMWGVEEWGRLFAA